MSASHPTLDLKQAAEYLKIHRNTLQERAKNGSIPGAAKIGKSWVFLEEGLREYIFRLSPCPWPARGSYNRLNQRDVDYDAALGLPPRRGRKAADSSGRAESVLDRAIRLKKIEERKRRGW